MFSIYVISKYPHLPRALRALRFAEWMKGVSFEIKSCKSFPAKVDDNSLIIADQTISFTEERKRGALVVEISVPVDMGVLTKIIRDHIDGLASAAEVFSYRRRELQLEGVVIALTEIEAKIMQMLHRAGGRVTVLQVERELNIERLDTQVLHTHLHRLNKKLAAVSGVARIQNRSGVLSCGFLN